MYKAIVSLAPGQVGFYDELSGVHLSLQNKEATILHETNTIGLIKAINEGKILVVAGSLDLATSNKMNKVLPTYYRLLDAEAKKRIKEELINKVCETPADCSILEVKKEEVALELEEKKEEVVEEVKEIKTKKSKTQKPKTAKSTSKKKEPEVKDE